jgi:hypothetical protein
MSLLTVDQITDRLNTVVVDTTKIATKDASGFVSAATATVGDTSTKLATTQFVANAIGPGVGASASGAIYENATTISEDYTMGAGKNGHSVGPITIASGKSVTIPSGQTWVIDTATHGGASTSGSSSSINSVVVATAGQTVVATPAYVLGAGSLQVFVNGLLVRVGFDYTETTTTSITFLAGLSAGDEVALIAWATLPIATADSGNVAYTPAGTGAVATTVQSKLRESVSVKDFGAVGDGVTDDTVAFVSARAITNRYHIPSGTYVLSASPDPFLDCFTSSSGVTLVVGGVSYDCSNAFAGPLRYVAASATKTNIVHAKSGNIIMYWQDGAPGTATGFYRGLAFTTNSHWAQAQPSTNGGSTDILWQRSTLNADPAGNRFNETFDEANDRLIFSYATSASGSPAFDTFMQCYAGTSPSLQFPAVIAQFQKGISIKQRSAGGYEFTIEQTSSTQAKFKELGGAGTTYMTFRTGAFGFYGSTGTSQQTVTGSRGGNAALASLITALANTGLIVDGTTA